VHSRSGDNLTAHPEAADPQALFATESLAQALRQLEVYGHHGLPVLSADGRQIPGWVTASDVLQTIARQITTTQPQTPQAQITADDDHADPDLLRQYPPTPLPGYRLIEVTITPQSAAAGQTLSAVTWPRAGVPVSVLRGHQRGAPHPQVTLAPGDRVSLLTVASDGGGEQ
jgi:chloride channel protein, CIC family